MINNKYMNLSIHKDQRGRNTGKFFHKVPSNTLAKKAKKIALKDITSYIELNDDFGRINYLFIENRIIRFMTFEERYTNQDLY